MWPPGRYPHSEQEQTSTTSGRHSPAGWPAGRYPHSEQEQTATISGRHSPAGCVQQVDTPTLNRNKHQPSAAVTALLVVWPPGRYPHSEQEQTSTISGCHSPAGCVQQVDTPTLNRNKHQPSAPPYSMISCHSPDYRFPRSPPRHACCVGYLCCGALDEVHPRVRLPQLVVAAAAVSEDLHPVQPHLNVATGTATRLASTPHATGLLPRAKTGHSVMITPFFFMTPFKKNDNAIFKNDNAIFKNDNAIVLNDNAIFKNYNTIFFNVNAIFTLFKLPYLQLKIFQKTTVP